MNAPFAPQSRSLSLADQLRCEGYVIVRQAIPADTLQKLQAEMDLHFDAYPNSEGFFYGDKTVRFGGVFHKSAASQSLAIDPTILGVMKEVLSPCCERIQINLTQAIGIKPGETAQIPHRDDEMFPFPHPGTQFMINCMWALSSFNANNGGTRIWLRS